MWSKKWYLKRNISYDAHLLNELLEKGCALRWCHRGVGKKTEETVGFPEWTARFSVWKTSGNDSSKACAIACQNCAVYSVFPSGMTSHSKIAQLNWECTGRLIASQFLRQLITEYDSDEQRLKQIMETSGDSLSWLSLEGDNTILKRSVTRVCAAEGTIWILSETN